MINNDWQAETGPWAKPWNENQHPDMITALTQVFEHPMPLPISYLHLPETQRIIGKANEVGHLISLPYKKMLRDYANWMEISATLQLKKSLSSFKNLIPQLEECKTIREQIETIMAKETDETGKTRYIIDNPQIREKFSRTLTYLHNLKIMDTSTPHSSKWKLIENTTGYEKELPPWTACLQAGIIPSIQTREIRDDKLILPLLQRRIGNDILDWQETRYAKENQTQIWMFYDEMERIASKKRRTAAADMLEQLFTAGRMARIGVWYATQDFSETLDPIIQNTNYLFSFRQKAKETTEIRKNFDLPNWAAKKLKWLPEFEMMALTTKHFIIYDMYTGEKYKETQPIIGKCLPPLNQHKQPKEI